MQVKVLTISGSDICGGSGIQTDLRTFQKFGVHGANVITSLIARSSLHEDRILDVPAKDVEQQLEHVFDELTEIHAIKTGFFVDEKHIQVVADSIEKYLKKINRKIPIIVDPSLVEPSFSESCRMSEKAIKLLTEKLIPLATVLTVNVVEAKCLVALATGKEDMSLEDAVELEEAADIILGTFKPECVIIKGGHLRKDETVLKEEKQVAVDFVKIKEGDVFRLLVNPRILTFNTCGSGCAFSAAICCQLAKVEASKKKIEPKDIIEASETAKEFVSKAIEKSYKFGKNYGTLFI